jgi:hypothetical protein
MKTNPLRNCKAAGAAQSRHPLDQDASRQSHRPDRLPSSLLREGSEKLRYDEVAKALAST